MRGLAAMTRHAIKCVHGEHTKCNPKCPAENGYQEAAGETGEEVRPEREFSDFRRGRVLRCRSGKIAGRNPASGPKNQDRPLYPPRGHEGVASVLGHQPRAPSPKMHLWQESRRWGPVPVEIVWSPLARARLQEIRAYVAADKPDAAEQLATRIVAVVEALRDYPSLGRPGFEPGVRELVIGGAPYLVFD